MDGMIGMTRVPSTIEEIIRVLKDIVLNDLSTPVTAEDFDESSSLIDDLKLDSVAMIELISAIEQRLQFEFEDSDLRVSSFATVRALAEVIGRRLGVASEHLPQ